MHCYLGTNFVIPQSHWRRLIHRPDSHWPPEMASKPPKLEVGVPGWPPVFDHMSMNWWSRQSSSKRKLSDQTQQYFLESEKQECFDSRNVETSLDSNLVLNCHRVNWYIFTQQTSEILIYKYLWNSNRHWSTPTHVSPLETQNSQSFASCWEDKAVCCRRGVVHVVIYSG